ncbi:hypothetical protein [Amycolatopsis sp. NPDC049868]|uniref:phthiocerol/phthiodiolone dimycocerosyl transferase family protein n=1 Tax=Amycolatopsis sp. NPDC049868 TaxID=3363934 RepID=UPI0037B0DB21
MSNRRLAHSDLADFAAEYPDTGTEIKADRNNTGRPPGKVLSGDLASCAQQHSITVRSSPVPFNRTLAPSEAMHTASGFYTGYTTGVRGQLDQAALSAAFQFLRKTYPVLSCSITRDAMGGTSIGSEDDVSIVASLHGAQSDEPLAGFPDPGDRVTAVHVVRRGADLSWVTLLIHHAIADGAHGIQLLVDLWSFYADVVEDREIVVCSHPYPQSIEKILSDRSLTVDPAEAPGADQPPTLSMMTVDTRLTVEATNALVTFGHRTNATINSLVSAALLMATTEALDIGIGELVYTYSVNLRRRLIPPVGPAEGTNVLGIAQFTADVSAGKDIAALARAVTAKFSSDLAVGGVQHFYFHNIGDYMRSLPAMPGLPLWSTNLGKIPTLDSPADIAIEDFLISRYAQKPQFVTTSLSGGHIITTFNGQLNIWSTMPEIYASTVANRVRTLLTDLRIYFGRSVRRKME